jgi:lysophospholipase L1-like esterase
MLPHVSGKIIVMMKIMLVFSIAIALSFPSHGQTCPLPFHIVVLGSSTAYGTGSKPILDSSWVNRYAAFLHAINPAYQITNLAVGGYDTYCIQPDDYLPPKGRRRPDSLRNITRALSLNPDAIIINMPSNDQAEHLAEQEQKDNFLRVATLAEQAGVPLWVTTTQPRNMKAADVSGLIEMRDWIRSQFGSHSIDFWTGLAAPSGIQDSTFGAGDGIHLNNAGHRILVQRVLDSHISDTLCLMHAKF